jgi:putative ABC transport system ATP-binding protein
MIYAGCSKLERNERAAEVLKQVNLTDRMDHQPNQLSGAQRQRFRCWRKKWKRIQILLNTSDG